MLIEARRSNPQLSVLAQPIASEDNVVQHCPLREKTPARMLVWNMDELGGGFHRPTVRPDYAIAAYAQVISVLKADFIVLLGLTRSIGESPQVNPDSEHIEIKMEVPAKDSGVSEVNRILAKLRKTDPAAGWQAVFLKEKNNTEYVYINDITSCILHRAKGATDAAPISFEKLDVFDSSANISLGLTGKFIATTFSVPKFTSEPITLMAPLGHPSPAGAPKEPAATGALPSSWILALSAPENLLADRAAFNSLRASLDVLYQAPSEEGSLLKDDFWKSTAESRDDLLGNFAALGLDQISKQDLEMHWQALTPPTHPTSLQELTGNLADTFLIRHGTATKPPVVQEMRTVDLARAALSSENLAKLSEKANAAPTAIASSSAPLTAAKATAARPKEDAQLVALLQEFQEYRGGIAPGADPVDALAHARYFSLALSRHWPVVAQIHWDT